MSDRGFHPDQFLPGDGAERVVAPGRRLVDCLEALSSGSGGPDVSSLVIARVHARRAFLSRSARSRLSVGRVAVGVVLGGLACVAVAAAWYGPETFVQFKRPTELSRVVRSAGADVSGTWRAVVDSAGRPMLRSGVSAFGGPLQAAGSDAWELSRASLHVLLSWAYFSKLPDADGADLFRSATAVPMGTVAAGVASSQLSGPMAGPATGLANGPAASGEVDVADLVSGALQGDAALPQGGIVDLPR